MNPNETRNKSNVERKGCQRKEKKRTFKNKCVTNELVLHPVRLTTNEKNSCQFFFLTADTTYFLFSIDDENDRR